MFTETETHFSSGFLWWVVAFAAAMASIDLWMRDYGAAAFRGGLAIFVALQAATQGRPLGWLRAAHWSLIALLGALLVARMMRWTGLW